MKIGIDTKEDSHEDIKKVIKMLQNIVGDSQEIFINQPSSGTDTASSSSPFGNIFGDTSSQESSVNQETTKPAETEDTSQSTEDLFAELFSEEELKKMDTAGIKEEEEPKTKGKKHNIELY